MGRYISLVCKSHTDLATKLRRSLREHPVELHGVALPGQRLDDGVERSPRVGWGVPVRPEEEDGFLAAAEERRGVGVGGDIDD